MIDKLVNFIRPTQSTIYDTESLTTLESIAKVIEKVNNCIQEFNNLEVKTTNDYNNFLNQITNYKNEVIKIVNDIKNDNSSFKNEFREIIKALENFNVTLEIINKQSEYIQDIAQVNQDNIDKGSIATKNEINKINASLKQKANEVDVVKKGFATLSDFDETTRALLQGLGEAETNINAVLGIGNVTLNNLNDSIKNKISTFIDISGDLNEGKMCNGGSTSIILSDNSNYNCIVFSVSRGDVIKCSGAVDRTSAYLITFTNNEGLIIEKYDTASTITFFENKTYIVPNGATKAYFNYHKVNTINVENTYIKKMDMIDIKSKLNNLSENTNNLILKTNSNTIKIDDIIEKGYVDLFPTKWELGYIKADGSIGSNNITAHTSLPIMVKNGDKIICNSDNITLDILDTNNTLFTKLEGKGEQYIANGKISININFKFKDLSTITDLEKINNLIIGKSILQIETTDNNNNYWKDKKIIWYGTSIPAGYNNTINGHANSYPLMIGDLLGATVINKSVGGSMVSSGTLNSFCNTLAEKQAMSGWNSATDTEKEKYKSSCYDQCLDPYLTDDKLPDLFVFDYGYNDWSITENSNLPNDLYDKSTLIGGLNWIFNRIKSKYPQARIVMIGHYTTNQITNSVKEKAKIITECQEKVSELWGIPLFRTWEYMGWSPMKIKTTGYWDSDSSSNTYKQWIKSGGNEQEISILGTYLYDGLHPHSDYSGKALNLYRDVLYPFIRDIR